MKNLFLLICLLVSHALAGFDGFYAGAAGGVSATLGKQRGDALGKTAFEPTVFVTYPLDINTTMLRSTAAGILYVGYGFKCNCFFGGVEAFAQYSNDSIGVNRRNLNSAPLSGSYLISD